ncbi:DUF1326 domain-containing protein [Ruegeria arenilitoris]|uniref:DUF1326 domain-containing protein n=1 Tax=Ruegeria arenilitoris TaxID=1173585 RepID=UPI00147CD54B|nr:DUF1326 domain-containing protein [Ruegeria arenilitoris]
MTAPSWVLNGIEYGNCNCDYGCPCQFNGRPSSADGSCRYAAFTQIYEGRYGDVNLDGLRFAWIGGWSGPVHECGGEILTFIDARADDRQRNALQRIVLNEDTEELKTHYAVFCAMCTTIHEPKYALIAMVVDMETRVAHAEVPGIVVSDVEPVRNPVTGKEHRAQIVLPEGFASTLMETASGTVKATDRVKLDFTNTFAGIARLHMTDQGIVRHQ